MDNKLINHLKTIVEKNIEHVPYEGDDIDKDGIAESTSEFIFGLLKGYQTWVNKKYRLTNNGWLFLETNQIHSKKLMIEYFIQSVKKFN